MGILNAESLGKIDSMLNPDTPQVESMSTSSEPSVDQDQPTADAPQNESVESSEATEDVKQDVEVASADDGAGHSGEEQERSHHVPYNRFKKVLDARNTHKSEVEKLRQEMAQLRKQMESAPEASYGDDDDYLGDSDLDDLLGDYSDHEAPAQPEVGPQMSELLQRIEHFEVYQAEQELTREVAAAKEQYPNVPDDVIYQAVARDPSVSVLAIAEQYSAFVGGVEEAAIARYMKEHGMETPQAEAPPRPARSGAPPQRQGMPDKAPPKNLSESKSALLEYLRNNNVFKR
jgi:hypothetical protein